MTIQTILAKLKAKINEWRDKANDWVDEKVTEFVMAHLNLEETILCAAGKAARDKFHLTSLMLLAAYYIWRVEAKFKSWFSKNPKTEYKNV